MTISLRGSRLAKLTVAAVFLVAIPQPGLGQQLKYKPISVKTPDGLTISAQEWGNPSGALREFCGNRLCSVVHRSA